MAGQIAARESLQKSSLYFQSNYQGTHNLLTSMKQYGVHQLIFASTAAVYKPNVLLSEQDLLSPSTPYGWSKLYCEQAIQRSNISAYILRLFNVGGALNTLYWERITIQRHISFHWPLMLIFIRKILYFMGRTKRHLLVVREIISMLQM